MPEKIFELGDDVLVIVEPDTGAIAKADTEDFRYVVDLDSRGSAETYHVASLEKIPCTHWVKKHGYELKMEAKKINGKRFLTVTPYHGGYGRGRGGRISA